jgi:hypothetical protein
MEMTFAEVQARLSGDRRLVYQGGSVKLMQAPSPDAIKVVTATGQVITVTADQLSPA